MMEKNLELKHLIIKIDYGYEEISSFVDYLSNVIIM